MLPQLYHSKKISLQLTYQNILKKRDIWLLKFDKLIIIYYDIVLIFQHLT